MADQNVTGLIERIVFYAVSAIFLSYNGGKSQEAYFKLLKSRNYFLSISLKMKF